MQKNHMKKMWIGIAIGAVVCTLVLGLLFVVVVVKLFMGEQTIITDVSKYEETLDAYIDDVHVHTGFIAFPETIPDSATDIDFYCSHKIFFAGSAIMEVYLQCTYDDTDYQIELERLKNTYKQYGSTIKHLLYDEESFAYPAYLAVAEKSGEYEYALLSEENQITYIFVSYFSEEGMDKIPEEYMPFDYRDVHEQFQEDETGNYSIYYVRKREYADGTVGWEYDYTRDAQVAVENHHYERIDYNLFYVNTYLDETDTEIISNCSFRYYESKYDSLYGLPDEILYEELKGYKFKSLELNEEQTISTVTYYDGEEEKTWEYEIPNIQGEK